MTDRPALHIICSDRARNGKTLLARLLTDWILLGGGDPFVLDLDAPDAPLAARHPDRSLAADFSRVTGRVAVFDTIMNDAGRSHVLDLPARDLDVFLSEARKIGFLDAAREAGREVVFLFMVARSGKSVLKAREVSRAVAPCVLHPARNTYVGDLLDDDEVAELYLDLFVTGEIVLPKISAGAMATVEDPGFSFRDFVEGRIEAPSSFQQFELLDFTNTVFEQLAGLRLRLDLDNLRDMGLI
jgi:hypothetical protein